MRLTIPYHYTETVIPKRCRKPRPVEFTATISLTINEITNTEAPVAFIQHTQVWNTETGHYEPADIVYRWWRNKLFVLYNHSDACEEPKKTQTTEEFIKRQPKDPSDIHLYLSYMSKEKCRKSLIKWAREIVFIEGLRWEAVGEPRYVIMTFGLGCNHGLGFGTSLYTDNYYNPNISNKRYFRIDQYKEAIQEAARIATNRGDTKALPIESQNPDTFEIWIPEAVRLKPNKEHGEGDPFINKIEGIVEEVKDPTIAGLAGLMLAFKS